MKTGDIVIYKGMLGRVVKSNQLYKFHPVNYGRCYFDTLDTITEVIYCCRQPLHFNNVW